NSDWGDDPDNKQLLSPTYSVCIPRLLGVRSSWVASTVTLGTESRIPADPLGSDKQHLGRANLVRQLHG
ncbi:hypothetical protein, partial [Paenibacillus koleovorans]|uniref:hypothetical protein n=1 Tax=Paenibacillus koleovorans TaxID=121608 RepID=UPI001C3F5EE7